MFHHTNSPSSIFKVCIAVFIVCAMLSLAPTNNIPIVFRQLKYGIVTFFSKNHACEAIHSCRSYAKVDEIRDGTVIVIGVYAPDVTPEMLAFYRKNCPFVQLHPFKLDGYPENFKNLRNYRFKFPVVASLLPKFNTIMYVDASIHFVSGKNESLTDLFQSMETKFAPLGIRVLSKSTHTNFPVIHPDMYAFFNVTKKQTGRTTQFQSGVYLINNSPEGWKFMDKLVGCAVEPKCMAPKGAKVECPYQDLKKNHRVLCHRFDQSALNMGLIELYGTDESLYYQPSSLIEIVRKEKCEVHE